MVDFVPEAQRGFLRGKKVHTTCIQYWPFARKHFRKYLSFMPWAIEHLNLSKYNLILSSSHAVAKGVKTRPDQMHISYVHSPMRYAWDFQDQYLQQANLHSGLKSRIIRYCLARLRKWDKKSAQGVTHFIANSQYIADRIQRCYGRKADVIYPPVDVERFVCCETKQDYYFTASRLVSYKRIDLIVQAFAQMPDKQLVVIGDGPEYDKITAMATDNIQLLGYQSDAVLIQHLQQAKAFVFAAEEDFGILPVEAQACGTPVIVYGKGGALETMVPGKTGFFFDAQTMDALISAVNAFEAQNGGFCAKVLRQQAEQFSIMTFRENYLHYIKHRYDE